MNQLIAWLSRLVGSWKCWIVVAPWDIGIRIRLGKIAASLGPGLHFRLPFVDQITIINTRLRIETTPMVTLPSKIANHARSVSAVVGYRIVDPLRAIMVFNQPGVGLVAFVQAMLCRSATEAECLEAVRAEGEKAGMVVEFVYFSENVDVRTLRLIQGGGALYSGAPMNMPMEMGVPSAATSQF